MIKVPELPDHELILKLRMDSDNLVFDGSLRHEEKQNHGEVVTLMTIPVHQLSPQLFSIPELVLGVTPEQVAERMWKIVTSLNTTVSGNRVIFTIVWRDRNKYPHSVTVEGVSIP